MPSLGKGLLFEPSLAVPADQDRQDIQSSRTTESYCYPSFQSDAAIAKEQWREGGHWEMEEEKKDPFQTLWRKYGLADTLITDFWPPELVENKFLWS